MSSQDADYVLVKYTHPNRGQHKVLGVSTGISYGYRAGGEVFLVHINDVKAQNHLFEIINTDVNVPEVKRDTVSPTDLSTGKPVEVVEEKISQQTFFDLQTVAGISSTIAQQLNSAGVQDLQGLIDFGADNLMMIKGIGPKRAEAIIASAVEMSKQ